MSVVTSNQDLSIVYTSEPFFLGALTSDIDFVVGDLDSPIPLGFDAPVNTGSDPASATIGGLITFNQRGRFKIEALPAIMKDAAGGMVKFVFRADFNSGGSVEDMIIATLNPDQHHQTNPIFWDREFQVGDTVQFYIWPDSSEGFNGGLFTDTITLTAATTPSWCVKIQRIWETYPQTP